MMTESGEDPMSLKTGGETQPLLSKNSEKAIKSRDVPKNGTDDTVKSDETSKDDSANPMASVVTDDEINKEEVSKGTVPPSDYEEAKAQLGLILPLCATQVLTDGVNVMVDNIFLGHISRDALTASGMGNSWVMTGMAFLMAVPFYGITVLAGQAAGAGRKKMASVWLARGLFLMMASFPFAVAFAATTGLFCQASGASPVVESMALNFAWLRLTGFAGFGIMMATRSYMQTVEQDMVPSVIAAIASSILNVPLNYLFIGSFGFVGSPLATASAQWVAVLGFVWYVRYTRPKMWEEMLSGFDSDLVFRWNGMFKMLEATGPGVAEFLMMFVFGAVVFLLVYRFMVDPQDSISAMTLMGGVLAVLDNIMMAIGSTTSTRTANAITHSEDPQATRAGVTRSLRIALFWMGVFVGIGCVIVLVDASWFSSLFTNDARVIHLSALAFTPLMLGYLLMGFDQVFLQTCAGVGYFNAVSTKGGLDMMLMCGGMVAALYIKPRLDYMMWAMPAVMICTVPLSFLIFFCIDWEVATQKAIEKTKEADQSTEEAGDEEAAPTYVEEDIV